MQTGSVHEGIPTSSTSGTIPKQKPKGQIDSDKSSQVVEKTLEELQQGVQQQRSMPVSEGRTISQVLDGATPGGKVGDMSSILGGKEMPIGRLSQEADGLPVPFPHPLKDGAVRPSPQLPRDEKAVKSIDDGSEEKGGESGLYSETGCKSHQKKVYIDKSAVEFFDAGIKVKMHNEVVMIKSIRVDERGLYFLKSEATMTKGAGREYSCPGRGCGATFSSSGALASHMRNCRYCRN